jgi:Replication-relaxation
MKQPLPQDRRILEALGRFHVLTAEQVRRLFFGKSLTYVQSQVMPRLVAAGLVRELHFPKTMRYGSFPIVYTLTSKGWREIGLPPPRFKRTEQSGFHMLHTLAVTDVCIGAELLSRRYAQITLVDLEHEWDFKRNPFRFDGGSVAPDGLLRMRIGTDPQDVLLEVDRRTEVKAQWQAKIEPLLALAQGSFQQLYDTPFAPTIAVLTTGGEVRRQHLQEWTAELDTESLCLFASMDPAADPDILFLSPVWYPSQPGAAQSLFTLP